MKREKTNAEVFLDTNTRTKTNENMLEEQQNLEPSSSFDTVPRGKKRAMTQYEKTSKQQENPEPSSSFGALSKRKKRAKTQYVKTSKQQEIPKLSSSSGAVPKAKTCVKTQYEKMPKLSLRFDGRDHLPDFDSEKSSFRCKFEDCGIHTTVFCTKCKVHICFVPGLSNRSRNCFKEFHSLELNES